MEDGVVDWTTPHVLFENRAIVDFSTDPKTGDWFHATYSTKMPVRLIWWWIRSLNPYTLLACCWCYIKRYIKRYRTW